MNKTRTAAALAGMLSFFWVGMTAAVAAGQRRLLFNPTVKREVASPRSSAHRTRPVVLRAADGTRLSGWLMTPRRPGPHPAVLYFGGRSEEVSWVARDAGRLFPNMSVLAMNYRGYGDSHGDPAEQHLVEDGRSLFDWLAERHEVDAQRIAVVGRSLGSGVAVQVVQQRPAHSLVLITPYDSILALAKRRFRAMPVEWVLRHRFESIKFAKALTAPTFVLRAATDDVVPHSHTDQLVAQLSHLLLDETIPASDHMNIPYLERTQQRIADFLSARFFGETDGRRAAATLKCLEHSVAAPADAVAEAVQIAIASQEGAGAPVARLADADADADPDAAAIRAGLDGVTAGQAQTLLAGGVEGGPATAPASATVNGVDGATGEAASPGDGIGGGPAGAPAKAAAIDTVAADVAKAAPTPAGTTRSVGVFTPS